MDQPEKRSSKQRRVLGRGFASLLPTPALKSVDSDQGLQTRLVAVDQIGVNQEQPRKQFDTASMKELASSIRRKGILQPLLVQVGANKGYELIAGERRLRAARLAGLKQVPVVVRPSHAEERLELALIENLQREDLNPIEEAQAYQDLMQRFDLTQEEVATRVGKHRSTVANALRLLKLPKQLQGYLIDGRLSAGQARPLLGLNDAAKMIAMAEQIVGNQLSARAVEAKTVSSSAAGAKPSQSKKRAASPIGDNPHLSHLRDRLRRRFATKTAVHERQGRGKIEVHFYSLEELARILELMGVD